MASWDHLTAGATRRRQDDLLRSQIRDGIAPFSPFWRDRFKELGLGASAITSVADLAKLPAAGEHDVCTTGDPRDAARLVLQADEAGYALHAPGPDLRKALVRRLGGAAAYRRSVESLLRPTSYHFAGRAFGYPVASTRSDLDVIARAGARAWQVLGLTSADVLVSALPTAARLEHVFLSYAALGAGAPALFPGDDAAEVARTLDVVTPTVIAAATTKAARLIADLDAAGAALSGLTRLLLVGTPDEDARGSALDALAAAGARDAEALFVAGVPEGRVLWAECTAGSGLHSYPDLEVLELVDPDSGEGGGAGRDGGELVLTQLGLRGSALLRWRTGLAVDSAVRTDACTCGRTVPRVPSELTALDSTPRPAARAGARAVAARPSVRTSVVPSIPAARRGSSIDVDLQAVGAALDARDDLADWSVEVTPGERSGADELVVYIVPTGDASAAAVGAYRDARAASGVRATQVVVLTAAELSRRTTRAAGASALSSAH